MAYDVEAVKIAVRNILTWKVGESVIRPEFGHNLHKSFYSQMNDFNRQVVCEEIKRAIEENELRVNVKGVFAEQEISEDGYEVNGLRVKVTYEIVGNKSDGAEIVETALISGR